MAVRPRRSNFPMGRRCSICCHPDRTRIDKALVAGHAYRAIAARTGTSPSALVRHRQNHLVEQIARAEAESRAQGIALLEQQQETKAGELRHAIDVVAQLKAINGTCLEVLKQARSDRKHSLSLRAVDRIVRQIELQARLLGQIQEGPTVNVAILPEWHGIRSLVADALEPYPEARIAIARALQDAGV